MAVRGAKLKPDSQRKKPSQASVEWTEVVDRPFDGPVPVVLPGFRDVLTRDGLVEVELRGLTREWWAVVTRMPHCVLWRESDWFFVLATAIVADAAFSGVASAMVELRSRERQLGVTRDQRRDLRIRYVPEGEPVQDSGVSRLSDYREL